MGKRYLGKENLYIGNDCKARPITEGFYWDNPQEKVVFIKQEEGSFMIYSSQDDRRPSVLQPRQTINYLRMSDSDLETTAHSNPSLLEWMASTSSKEPEHAA